MNRVIAVISAVIRETIILVSFGAPVPIVSEIMRAVFLSTTGISKIKRLKIRTFGSRYLKTTFQDM